MAYIGEPQLIWAFGGEFLAGPVGGNGPIVAAVRGACPEPLRRYCLYAFAAHETRDPATAHRVPQAAQGRVDSRPAIASAMCQMEAPDLGEQSAIGCLARAFRPAAPSIISRRRDGHDIAQDANWEDLALRLNDAEFHFGGSGKMRSVFLGSPAPCAGARSRAADEHSRRPNPRQQAGSKPACWGAAAIPPSSRHFCCAKPAAAQLDSLVM
jgi:hypothetical protein